MTGGRPLDGIAWPVRTERLTLRVAAKEDAAAMWRYRQLEPVYRWLQTVEHTFDDFQARFEDLDRLAKTIMVELEGEVIGDLMVGVEDAWAQADVAEQARGVQAELGWSLDPRHTGHGYATEAVRELLRICFEDLGLRRVTANCFADNEESWRLMERVGMRRELHSVRESLHRTGGWLDGYGYALLADEWAASRRVR
jgi:RimJ/RimL family protein N-acetyltransferase